MTNHVCRFLLQVGYAKITQFLNRDADAELFEDILSTVLTADDSQLVLNWLDSLSSIDRFDVLKSFLSKDILARVETAIQSSAVSSDDRSMRLTKTYFD